MPESKRVSRRSNLWRVAGALICLLGTAVALVVGLSQADLPGWRDYPGWLLVALSILIPFWALGLPLILLPTFAEFQRAGLLRALGDVGRELLPWGRYRRPPEGEDHPQV